MRVCTTTIALRLETLIDYLEEKRDSLYPRSAGSAKADLDLNDNIRGLVLALPYQPGFKHLAAYKRSHQHFMVYWSKLEIICSAWEFQGEVDRDTWMADKKEIENIVDEIETAVPHDPEEVHDRLYY